MPADPSTIPVSAIVTNALAEPLQLTGLRVFAVAEARTINLAAFSLYQRAVVWNAIYNAKLKGLVTAPTVTFDVTEVATGHQSVANSGGSGTGMAIVNVAGDLDLPNTVTFTNVRTEPLSLAGVHLLPGATFTYDLTWLPINQQSQVWNALVLALTKGHITSAGLTAVTQDGFTGHQLVDSTGGHGAGEQRQTLVQDAFLPTVLHVNTTRISAGSSANNQFKLPLASDGVYSFTVDWGDASVPDTITAWDQAAVTHTYAATGQYTVTIHGKCAGFAFRNDGDRLKVINILAWGTSVFLGTASAGEVFRGCASLTSVTPSDAPRFRQGNNHSGLFRDCTLLSSVSNLASWVLTKAGAINSLFRSCQPFDGVGMSAWDVSKNDRLDSMFENDTVFNQNIGAWDVSQVTTMFTVFNGATAFNNGGSDSIKNWDTSKVQTLYSMFSSTAFNQPIGSWNVSSVGAMAYMFSSSQFNQDISGWDTSSCTNMSYMFRSCPFNQDISSWNVETVANFQDMFSSNTAFRHNVGTWWLRSATNLSGMFSGADVNVGGSPVNLVLAPQDYSSVNWTRTNLTATVNTTAAPDGSTTADSLKPSVTNSGDHSVQQTKTVVIGTTYTVRVALKAAQLTWAQLICYGAFTDTPRVYVNLLTGAIEHSVGSVSVTDIGSGWYVLEITGVASTTSLTMQVKAWNNASGTSFAGNASDAILAWQASMFASAGKSLDNYSNFLKDITGWTGSGDGAANRTGVTSAAVAVGGSGYTVGDVLTVVGGTLGVGTKSAEVKVATIDGAGAVLTVTVKRGCGNYDTQPANAAATTGGTGNGCTLILTWGTKFAGLPDSRSFHSGNSKYNMNDRLAVNARKQLAASVGSGGKGWTITAGTAGGPL